MHLRRIQLMWNASNVVYIQTDSNAALITIYCFQGHLPLPGHVYLPSTLKEADFHRLKSTHTHTDTDSGGQTPITIKEGVNFLSPELNDCPLSSAVAVVWSD